MATSFDGSLDLLRKYPESPGIVAALRSLGVNVLHNVDATALDARVTRIASTGGRTSQQRQLYEHVIFNHPHTGTEDMRRHRSFLGHFFHAVARSTTTTTITAAAVATAVNDPPIAVVDTCNVGIRSGDDDECGDVDGGDIASRDMSSDDRCGEGPILASGGAVHVSLALEQPERWGLEEQAARHGFSLAHRRRFPAEQIDGYMTKRHQTGRSFQQKVQSSETLSFTWAAAGAAAPAAAVAGARKNDGTATVGLSDGCSRCSGVSGGEEMCSTIGGGAAVAHREQLGAIEGGTAGGHGGGDGEEADKDGTTTAVSQGRIEASASRSTCTLPPWLWPDVSICGGEGEGKTAAISGDGEPDLESDGDGGDRFGNADARTSAVIDTAVVDTDQRSGSAKVGGRGSRRSPSTSNGKAVVATTAALDLLPEVCDLCHKRYKTAQALRTHTRQYHELGQEGGVALAPKKEEPCPHPGCGRVFTSDRALDQHVSAKHRGDNVNIKPDWFVGSIYHLEPPPPPPVSSTNDTIADELVNGSSTATAVSFAQQHKPVGRVATDSEGKRDPYASEKTPVEVPVAGSSTSAAHRSADNEGVCHWCHVCGYWFSSAEDAQQHLDNLRPPIEDEVTRYECGACMKDFGSRRALLQHANFCGGAGGGGGGACGGQG